MLNKKNKKTEEASELNFGETWGERSGYMICSNKMDWNKNDLVLAVKLLNDFCSAMGF